MFSNQRLIYLQMQKTGCTHITNLLEKHVGGTQFLKHAPLTEPKGERIVIGSIRNPWDWYVSLWAFGCAGKGTVYGHLTTSPSTRLVRKAKTLFGEAQQSNGRPRTWQPKANSWHARGFRHHRTWRRLYGDTDNPSLFRQWIRFMLSETGKADLIDGYAQSGIRHFSGFMTFRFCQLVTDQRVWQEKHRSLNSIDALDDVYRAHGLLDRVIRMENLERDFVEVMTDLGYDINPGAVIGHNKTNTSSHRRWTEYYDEETSELVRTQERFLIEKFGYEGPATRGATISARPWCQAQS